MAKDVRLQNITWPNKHPEPPSKHKIFIYYLYNVGPTSSTLVRHCINVIKMFCVCWLVNDLSRRIATRSDVTSSNHNLFSVRFARRHSTHVSTCPPFPDSTDPPRISPQLFFLRQQVSGVNLCQKFQLLMFDLLTPR